jgi:hypothetical protein
LPGNPGYALNPKELQMALDEPNLSRRHMLGAAGIALAGTATA